MEIPASLRRWFVAHFGVNLLLGAPLLLVPQPFLRALGWDLVEGSGARFMGAALIAVGVQSLLTRNGGPATLRLMLNFKLVWCWAALGGLGIAAVDNAPDPVWALLAVFLAESSVWFHYRMLFEGEPIEEEDQELLPAAGEELSELMNLGAVGDPEKVHPAKSIDKVDANDINALFAAQAAEERAAAEALAAQVENAADEPAHPAPGKAAGKTMQGLAPEKRAEMDELDELLAASASTGIDDRKAQRLADLLAARKEAREKGVAPPPLDGNTPPGTQAPAAVANAGEASSDGDEAMSGNDIAAMLANGPEEKTLGSDDIAAMLAENPGDGDTTTDTDAVGSDVIAANKDTEPGPEEAPAAADDEVTETAAVVAEAASAEESVGSDDIAAMLAANEKAAPEESVGNDDIAAMLAANEKAAPEEDVGSDDIAAMLAANESEPAPEEDVGSDDIAAMLAGNEKAAPEPPAPVGSATADDDKPTSSDDVAALLAGDEERMSSEDLALMLAGNEGGSPEPPPAPPTLRGRPERLADELDLDDEAILFAEETPPPEPTEAVHNDAVLEAASADGPPETPDEHADEDAIAAMLAASRGN